MLDYYAVIMAGGGGTRFWPRSRAAQPKQFLPLVGEDPLIKQTVDRLVATTAIEQVLVITNALQAEGTRVRVRSSRRC